MTKVLDFSGGTQKRHQLKNMKIKEISLVDAGANPLAEVILSKRRAPLSDGQIATMRDGLTMLSGGALEFQPIAHNLNAVVAKHDGGDEILAYEIIKEAPADDAEPDADDQERKARKMKKKIRKALRRAFTKADRDFTDGQSGGGFHSESDRVGAQDARDDDAKAVELQRLVNQALQHPPLATEIRGNWLRRVFGADYTNALHSEQLRTLREVFDDLRAHSVVSKFASLDLETIAKSIQADSGGRLSFYQAYAKAARENPVAYNASRLAQRLELGAMTIKPSGALDEERAEQSIAAGPSNRRSFGKRNDVADADAMSPDQCNALLQDEAKRIRTEHGTSATDAYTMAAQRYPRHYEKSRNATGNHARADMT